MIDTDKYENMRQLFLDFIADPMCENDEAAWKRYLNTYDELLAKVERLRKREATFDAFIDSLDCHNEHEWMLIERIDEIDERLHGGEGE